MICAPAAERNKDPILEVLKQVINPDKPLKALEIASGTGQHASHFAQMFPKIEWQPSDVDHRHFESIRNYSANLKNVKEPVFIDVSLPYGQWESSKELFKPGSFDLMYCANLFHISPWNCTTGLFAAAGILLKPGTGLLVTYGPYAEGGVLSPASNVAFDASLRSQHKEWGIRDIDDLIKLAKENNLEFVKKFDMPANNKTLIFKKLPS